MQAETHLAVLAFEKACKARRAAEKADQALNQLARHIPGDDLAEYARITQAIEDRYEERESVEGQRRTR